MADLLSQRVPADIGERVYDLARDLFPILRSITGKGVRDTLIKLDKVLPIEIHAIPTGTPVFDWTVPKEWNLHAAYIEGEDGSRVVDVRSHNLHVVSYSVPVDATMSLAELRPHLHSLPEHPDWIPYRTSYYKESWGFCLPHRQLALLTEQRYHVRIDSTLEPGVLNYGEAVIRGESEEEFLISAHICHPSLGNDNVSGLSIAAWLGRLLADTGLRYTYRILFAPGTIGSIAWLATRPEERQRIKFGLIAALLGRPGPITYKRTRSGKSHIDAIVEYVLERHGDGEIIDFSPWGYDERQFNSPGIALDVGRLTRAPEGAYPEYHTSADNLELITPSTLADSLRVMCEIIDVLENDLRFTNLKGFCEPQLGKYGLYDHVGGSSGVETARLALLWVLNLSDGEHSLLDIAKRAGIAFEDIRTAASRLERAGLLQRM